MYEKINITENHLRALCAFTRGFDKGYYIRELQRLLKISPRTAQLILEDLEGKGVLESKIRGKIKVYQLKNNYPAQEYLIFAEEYKKIAFLEKKLLAKEVIEKITPFIQGIGLIFGSYAKGLEKKGSDMDIFIAGSYDRKKTEQIGKLYGINLSIKNYPLPLFYQELKKDTLIKEVLDNHVVFCGAEELVRRILNG